MVLDIKGLDKAVLLVELCNKAAESQQLALIKNEGPQISLREAEAVIKANPVIHSLNGLAIRLDLSGSTLDPTDYDSIHGQGAVDRIVLRIRKRR